MPSIYSYGDLVSLARNAGFRGDNQYIIAAIALAESGGNPTVSHKNDDGSTDYGVLQINSVHFHSGGTTEAEALDPASAFKFAYRLSQGSNFQPWTTFTSGAYKKFINKDYVSLSGGGKNQGGQTQPSPVHDSPSMQHSPGDPTSGLRGDRLDIDSSGRATGIGTSGKPYTPPSQGWPHFGDLPKLGSPDMSGVSHEIGKASGIDAKLGDLWSWLSSPMRIIKLVVGLVVLGGTLMLVLTPSTQQPIKRVVRLVRGRG